MNSRKGCIAVLPLGVIPDAAAQSVARHIPTYFHHPGHILPPVKIPADTFDNRRRQYDAGLIIKALKSMPFEGHFKVIAILGVDLFIPIFTHVLGEAQEGGRFALASMYRLKGESTGNVPSMSKVLERLTKVALHELGHLFNLVHCSDPKCLMHFAGNPRNLDEIVLDFCGYCSRYRNDALRRGPKINADKTDTFIAEIYR